METERGENLYQKMTAMFAEREEIFQKREAKLNNYRSELLALQKELEGQKEKMETEYLEQAELLEKEKKALDEERESLARERASMNQKREELTQDKESIAVEMERVMLAKLELESLKNERLRIENEQETLADQLNILFVDPKHELFSETPIEESVHQEAPEESPPSEPEIEEVIKKPEQKEPETMDSKEPAGLMERFVYKAKEIFPEGTALESTEELFCLSIGEKELRIMLQNPPAAVILVRREKTKTLLKGISQQNRAQEEWEFSYQDNCLRATMLFTEVTPADLVLQKCADAMNRYFL